MKILFAGQVPKDRAFPDANEDAYEIAPDAGKLALSDGASESYDSRAWARLLACRFVEKSQIDHRWLAEAITEYTTRVDYASLSWSKQAAFERGSFATLLGLEWSVDRNEIELLGIGDSVAVFLDEAEFVASFPYEQASEFQQRPNLLCSNAAFNTLFESPDFPAAHRTTWILQNRFAPVVLCMTDELAKWALRQAEEGRPVWDQLADMRTVTELEELVFNERQAKTMRADDTTLVSISFGAISRDELPDA